MSPPRPGLTPGAACCRHGPLTSIPSPGGALAHAFFPRRGEAHFDSAERWSLRSGKGRNLFVVVAHEVGHTLGLEHSPARSALMSPYYKKLSKDFVLSWDDILAIQNLYGEHRFPDTSVAPGDVPRGGAGWQQVRAGGEDSVHGAWWGWALSLHVCSKEGRMGTGCSREKPVCDFFGVPRGLCHHY